MVATRLRYAFASGEAGTYYIDLAKDLSSHHRKLHRQKKIYTVYGGYMVDGNPNRMDFNTAPDNWLSRAAVNRAFRLWKKLSSMTLEQSGGKAPKYSDFKVLLTATHLTGNTRPASDGSGLPIAGPSSEWDISDLTTLDPSEDAGGVTQTPDKFNLFIVGNQHVAGLGAGDVWSRLSMVKSWVDSRPVPNSGAVSPDYTADHPTDPLVNLFDSSDTLDNHLPVYENEGDLPPYDLDQPYGMIHPNSASNNLQRCSTTEIVSGSAPVAPVHGFRALCGLIQVVVEGNTACEFVLDVESEGEDF